MISAAVPNVKELVSEKQPIQDLAAPAAVATSAPRGIQVVTAATTKLREGIWSRFNAWIQCGIGEEGWGWLERNPELLVELLKGYGQALYDQVFVFVWA